MNPRPDRLELIQFLKQLQGTIIAAFESLEPTCRFERKPWDHATGGGGIMATIRGDIFEKAAVNWSGVEGDKFPGDDASGPFFATGLSLITHMQNPHAPTAHMNIRYIETKERWWLGGGYDLTPMGFPYTEDTAFFHDTARKTLHPFGSHLYPLFSENARNYFYIPHRKKERGVGGIFFDHYNSGNTTADIAMWQHVGSSFIDALLPLYQKRCPHPYSPEDKKLQHLLRGHYAEFNLAYDRGTRFGFLSGGNSEAILCSMPPVACW